MKLFIISFGPNPRIVAKFQTDRSRTFGENRAGKKIKKPTWGKTYTLAAATLRYADAAGSIRPILYYYNNYYIKIINKTKRSSRPAALHSPPI